MKMRLALLLLAMLPAWSASAQEAGFTNRATDLKERAAADARTVAPLAEGTPLTVLERAGGWTRVEAAGERGWVRVFHLRFPATAQVGAGAGVMDNVTSALGFGRERAKGATIATTGVRGLTPEDLRNSSPDPGALGRMHSYRADAASAERFAREGRLAAVSISFDEAAR
jgi:hypothetical protein